MICFLEKTLQIFSLSAADIITSWNEVEGKIPIDFSECQVISRCVTAQYMQRRMSCLSSLGALLELHKKVHMTVVLITIGSKLFLGLLISHILHHVLNCISLQNSAQTMFCLGSITTLFQWMCLKTLFLKIRIYCFQTLSRIQVSTIQILETLQFPFLLFSSVTPTSFEYVFQRESLYCSVSVHKACSKASIIPGLAYSQNCLFRPECSLDWLCWFRLPCLLFSDTSKSQHSKVSTNVYLCFLVVLFSPNFLLLTCVLTNM